MRRLSENRVATNRPFFVFSQCLTLCHILHKKLLHAATIPINRSNRAQHAREVSETHCANPSFLPSVLERDFLNTFWAPKAMEPLRRLRARGTQMTCPVMTRVAIVDFREYSSTKDNMRRTWRQVTCLRSTVCIPVSTALSRSASQSLGEVFLAMRAGCLCSAWVECFEKRLQRAPLPAQAASPQLYRCRKQTPLCCSTRAVSAVREFAGPSGRPLSRSAFLSLRKLFFLRMWTGRMRSA